MARLALRLTVVVACARWYARYWRDWSAVVCSSDLLVTGPAGAVDDTVAVTVRLAVWPGRRGPISQVMTPPPWVDRKSVGVGKEGGTGWAASALNNDDGPVLVSGMV